MNIETVPISSLHLDPANVRQHPDANLAAIKASLARFGQQKPIVVGDGDVVIAGNGTLSAARELGWTEIQIVRTKLSGPDAVAFAIADNRTAELAEWDDEGLGKILDSLQRDGLLEFTGFSDEDLGALLGEMSAGDVNDEGPEDAPARPISRIGDLWVMGEHRLLCGDSTKPEDMRRLMTGQSADMVWTDPPYGVSYVGKTADALEIQNDDLDIAGLRSFLEAALGCALAVTREGGSWYVAAPSGPQFLPFAQVLTDFGVWRQTLVWVKSVFVMGRSDYHYRHEAIFYGWKPGAAHFFVDNRSLDTVLEFDKPSTNAEHPTMKPLDLVKTCIANSSLPHQIVLDPFGGSGTTMIAAEATRRSARLIELDPRYVDVIVRRWETATGKSAVLDGAGIGLVALAEQRSVAEVGAQ